MSRVTVLGTGAMGSGVAVNLVAAGHEVTVWNRTATTGVELAQRLSVVVEEDRHAAVHDAEFVIACVTDDHASQSVWLDDDGGALGAMPLDATVIESSTVTPGWVRRLAAEVDGTGRRFLEAPMVGSRPQLAARQLRYLIGGEAAVLEHARPVLDASAAAVDHVGAVGDAATVKLVVNALLAVQVAAFGEVLGLLERSTVDLTAATALLAALPITSPAVARSLPIILEGDVRPNFPIDLVRKDLGYLDVVAAELGATTPLAQLTLDLAAHLADDGRGGDDITALASSRLAEPPSRR